MSPEEFLAGVPPIKVEYWAEGRLLGSRFIPARDERWMDEGKYFCCNVCQQVWGWIYYPNRFWQPHHSDCEQHNSNRYEYENIPGSLLSGGAYELEVMPLSVLKREFEVHVREIERRQKDEDFTSV